MRFNKHHDIQEVEFDLTAMIDVVLLLIIFFMLSSQFANVQFSPIELPREAGEGSIAALADRSMIIEMDAGGLLTIMDLGPVTREELVGHLERQKARAGGSLGHLEVLIRADRTCPAVHLNRLAGLLAKAGVRNWKLATAGGGA